MRIIVYPHAMELGGSQLNAIALAGAVRDRGHDVIVVGEPGPLVDRVHELGLEHVPIPLRRRRPSPQVAALLSKLAFQRWIDVVHGYEWPPALEAFYGPGLRRLAAPVATVLSMSVVPFFPRSIPLLVGTEQIRAAAHKAGHRRVTLLEPPVDTDADQPDPASGAQFRQRYLLAPDAPLVVMVCRLVPDLKRESLLAACDAVGELAAAGSPIQLAIVGDGPLRAEITERARQANAAGGRRAVVLTGELADPRPAYAAADAVVGMGGSALRALAFAKPLVVVGEQGFSELLTPHTLARFLTEGWFGLGAGSLGVGVPALRAALQRVLDSPSLADELGTFGRRLVVERFSLRRAAEVQEKVYLAAMKLPLGTEALTEDAVRSGAGLVGYKVHRKISRMRGRVAVDDANARPLSTVTPERQASP